MRAQRLYQDETRGGNNRIYRNESLHTTHEPNSNSNFKDHHEE